MVTGMSGCRAHTTRAARSPESRTSKRLTRLANANRALRKIKSELTAELEAMRCLHDFSTRLQLTSDLRIVLERTLDAVMALQSADFGNVQLQDREQSGLVIVAQRNFKPPFLRYFALLRDDGSTCGRAMRRRVRVVVEDVQKDPGSAAHRRVIAEAGFRGVQSTPLLSHHGELLGVLSTHFRLPHVPSKPELRLTDLYCGLLTQTIERARAEEERGKLAAIVQNSSDFISIATLAGRTVFINSAGRRMIGLADEERIGGHMQQPLLAFDHGERLLAEILPAVERCGFWEGETRLRHRATGVTFPVLQHIFYIRDAGTAKRLAIATICRDISGRRAAELAAREAQQELARASRILTLGALTTSIAHEVNQQLAAIVANGYACRRWIERAVPDLGEARASLDGALRGAERATDVIRRICILSSRETPPRILINVNDVIRDVLLLTEQEMQRYEVALSTQLSATLTRVLADRIGLQQVLLNLVINGIEAMRLVQGRRRCLSICSAQPDPLTIDVTVCDNGVGAQPEHLSRLFESFFTTKSHGIGLGLSISRRIIETLGGELHATANEHHGLTLSFSLPLSAKDHLTPAAPPAAVP
jgi:PAS domain S-box-containing protein